MKKVVLPLLFVALMSTASAAADQSAPVQLPLLTVGFRPFGTFFSPFDNQTEIYLHGYGAGLSAEYVLPFFPFMFVTGDLDYGWSAFSSNFGDLDSISLLAPSVGIGLRLPVLPWLTLRASASAGYYYGFLNQSSISDGSGSPFFTTGLGVRFGLGSLFGLDLESQYRFFLNLDQDIEVGIALVYNILPPGAVQPTEMQLDRIYPVFRTFYSSHPVGRLRIVNEASSPAYNVRVTLNIPQYMDAPQECAEIPELPGGAERSVELFALLKPSVLDVIQDTKAAAEVSVEYTVSGKTSTVKKTTSIEILHRTAMTWDQNAKAAAFVTYMDPAVLLFSNNVNAAVRGLMNGGVDKNLQTAIALHDALRLLGISYVSNPLTAYEVVSKDKLAVDTLKFPRDTFSYKSGDCSDLSILYCALLESVQIETAFVTIPGHIFIAFALGSSLEEAVRSVANPDDLIVKDGKAWVPVEVTERTKTFLDAWQEGAREWRTNLAAGQVGFDIVREAWKTYAAVDLATVSAPPALPDPSQLGRDFQDDVKRYVQRQIASRVAELQETIKSTNGSARAVNALGVLYARYGFLADAERQFQTAIAREDYLPALVNLGNLFFGESDMQRALAFYRRAHDKAPNDPKVLLGIARASEETGDFATVASTYARLKESSPALAAQFSYLGVKREDSTRASEMGAAREMIIWYE